jgi:hypothetical protein
MGDPNHPKPYAGIPSFEPLYTSARVGAEPETGTISHRPEDLHHDFPAGAPEREGWWSWADILVDFRTRRARREPLPRTLPEHEKRPWPTGAEGWSMTGYLITPSIHLRTDGGYPLPADGTSVLCIQDPTGFTVAIVVSNDKESVNKHKFATGRLATVLPGLREHLLGWTGNRHYTSEEKRRAQSASMRKAPLQPRFTLNSTGARVDLTVLFAALRDPHGWLGVERTTAVESVRFTGPYREVPAVRALLEWAAAGATSFEQVSHLVHAGLDAAEVTRWKAMEDPECPHVRSIPEEHRQVLDWPDETIAHWYAAIGGGVKNTKFAHNARAAGLSPEQAVRWKHLLVERPFEERLAIARLDAGGWTPEQAEELWLALREETFIPGSHYHQVAGVAPSRIAFSLVAEWAPYPAVTAIAHARAGLTPEATARMAEAGQMPEAAALEVMAALRHGRA